MLKIRRLFLELELMYVVSSNVEAQADIRGGGPAVRYSCRFSISVDMA